ncbi:MAG: hypothetical protein M3P18_02305 [Actinomycetota bacterium]|nr:hypothetical protein [Actinomycetota bacterium]
MPGMIPRSPDEQARLDARAAAAQEAYVAAQARSDAANAVYGKAKRKLLLWCAVFAVFALLLLLFLLV